MRELFAVFLTEDHLRRLIGSLDLPSDDINQLKNTWTLQESVATLFINGQIKVEPERVANELADDSMETKGLVCNPYISVISLR